MCSGFVLLVTLSCVLSGMAIALHLYSRHSAYTSTDYCSETYRNNIGHRSFSDRLCYPVIDAVYVWQNRSDPRWIREMESYRSLESEDVEEQLPTNGTRDSDDLRYSLRSLEKNAPWIHKVFIVTDGQIPSWLDAEHPKIEIVRHDQIFRDASLLPTFSLAAIELNLHHIPGLSKSFIYFRDNMFLGRPVFPYDFYSLESGHILYYSWDIPDCSPGCNRNHPFSCAGSYSQLGDGTCDAQCNTRFCQYDFGDCQNHPAEQLQARITPTTKSSSASKERCSEGCPFLWIGDGSCDRKCNVEECGFDAHDCMTEEGQGFDAQFVRFVCVAATPDHPVHRFLHSTFPDVSVDNGDGGDGGHGDGGHGGHGDGGDGGDGHGGDGHGGHGHGGHGHGGDGHGGDGGDDNGGKGDTDTTHTTVCLARVTVDAHGSFVALSLKDLSRLGYEVASIEIVNDGKGGERR